VIARDDFKALDLRIREVIAVENGAGDKNADAHDR
jgi:hypothetical protein